MYPRVPARAPVHKPSSQASGVIVAADSPPSRSPPTASPTTAPARRRAGTRNCFRSRSASSSRDGLRIDVLGFDSDELAELLAPPVAGLVDPDSVPETPAEPVTSRRDLDPWRPSFALQRLHRGQHGGEGDGRRSGHLMATTRPVWSPTTAANRPPTWAKTASSRRRPRCRHQQLGQLRQSHDTAVKFYETSSRRLSTRGDEDALVIYSSSCIMRAPPPSAWGKSRSS